MPYKDPERRREATRKYREANHEKLCAYCEANRETACERARKWHEANREKANERKRKLLKENPEKVHEQQHRYLAANREKVQEAQRRRYAANPSPAIASAARRRAAKLKATPPWQSREELDAIWIGRPEGYHVDHIHPLKGKLSCGLNVPWNLQYLPDDENLSKSNRMPQPSYFDWFSEAWTIHAPPTGRVWTLTDYDNI